MKNIKVLDSSALVAYFEGEEVGKKVVELLKEAAVKEKDLLISVINWGEVLSVIERRHGAERKKEVEHLIDQMHLEVVNVDKELARIAAHFKATQKLPYADCFAAALSFHRKISLVTADQDFKRVEDKIKIEWL